MLVDVCCLLYAVRYLMLRAACCGFVCRVLRIACLVFGVGWLLLMVWFVLVVSWCLLFVVCVQCLVCVACSAVRVVVV